MLSSFAFLDFGMPELLVILAIVLLLFGGKKLPEVSRALGESMKNLREGFSEANGVKDDLKRGLSDTRNVINGQTTAEKTPVTSPVETENRPVQNI